MRRHDVAAWRPSPGGHSELKNFRTSTVRISNNASRCRDTVWHQGDAVREILELFTRTLGTPPEAEMSSHPKTLPSTHSEELTWPIQIPQKIPSAKVPRFIVKDRHKYLPGSFRVFSI